MSSTRRSPLVRAFGLAAALAVAVAGLVTAESSSAVAAANGTGTGYLSTRGNQIIDSTGATVRLTGLNWFGMETDNHTFHGLWANVTWTSMMDQMARLGYNTIRVPFAGDSLVSGAQATSVNGYTNPDLVGLSPLQILDKVVEHAGKLGMRVILDRHRPSTAGQTALWYTPTVSEASEIADWKMLAARYAGNPTVAGADLFNEPHAEGTSPNGTGSCWGCGDLKRDWRLAAQRIGNALLATNPHWLILVEGVSCGDGSVPNVWDAIPDDPMTCDWWGGNLAGVAQYPVQLDVPHQLVYSAHDYGISVYDHQDWFDTAKHPDFPANLPAVWDHFWGYIYKQNIAPVLIGEFGSTLADPRDTQWMKALVAYLGTGPSGMSFTYWSWNPDSGDTGGIVGDDWTTVNQAKQAILTPALVPPVAGGGPTSTPTPTPTVTPSPSASPTSTPSTTPSPTPSASPTTTATPTPTPSPTPTTSTGSCTATVQLTNTWPSGFQAAVTAKNTGGATLNPWVVRFTVPAGVTIASGWNGTFTQSGTTVTVTAPSYSASLAPGATASIGFTANGTSSPAPGGVTLNGAACS